MSVGHPYFNRDVGMDQYNNAVQQNALNQQMFSLGQAQQSRDYACSAYINDFHQVQPAPTPKKEQSMFKAIACDVKGFILEHRSIIYFLAFALLVDHFVFRGAFKARLQGCVDRLVTKVEEKIQ